MMMMKTICRSFSRRQPTLNQRSYSGLLSGIENVDGIKNSHFYASSMDLKHTANFLKQASYVYQEARKDLPQTNHSSLENYLITKNKSFLFAF